MGIGAIFAAMNTMYAIVANRTREVGTLRALGFSRIAVFLLRFSGDPGRSGLRPFLFRGDGSHWQSFARGSCRRFADRSCPASGLSRPGEMLPVTLVASLDTVNTVGQSSRPNSTVPALWNGLSLGVRIPFHPANP